ncbi:MAG: DNA repair protein RecN [Desulfobulbaceae bacterium]|jgi:DNA repair protein RecN (Recombination protein N)|nr:DNA repair protein RecN [Desulfobulbaceae bacterium]
MLRELRIQNMALIDSLQLDFTGGHGGLAVLTGETGAGKSIILQALHLLAGGRGAASWIRSDRDQATVEGLFTFPPHHADLLQLLDEQEIEQDGECIIRRIFHRNGRSRFYVNDRLVTAGLVGDITENLVNIASQHDHQQLLVTRRHLDFLDTFGELWDLRGKYAELYNQRQQLAAKLHLLRQKEEDKEQRREFLAFQLDEISRARLVPGEDAALVEERDRLKSSAVLGELAGRSLELLRTGVLESIAAIRKDIEQAASLDKGLQPLAERIVSSCYEIEDFELTLKDYLEAIPGNQQRLEELNERLALFKQLQRKYGPTLESVIDYGRRAETELTALDGMEREIVDISRRLEVLNREVLDKAGELSRRRAAAGRKLNEAMAEELQSLGFSHAVFEVALDVPAAMDLDALQHTGRDQVEFLFSANPGEPAKPLARIASGGELSRLMLAMKCILARRDRVETVVFDEVDAGIGGQAAEAVARKIVELSSHHQVICITHLPQIAARADEHFMVTKSVVNGRTVSLINLLHKEERVMELARMLGGDNLTGQTIAYARELAGGRSGRPAS